jgi:lipocalin-like protein
MNIPLRVAAAWGASLAMISLVAIASAALAQSSAKPLRDQLVGHWGLVSVRINGAAPYGEAPKGSMFLDAAGHYSVVVITTGAARDISYFGTYTTDDADGSITIHIEASSDSAAAGRDEKRFVRFDGDELIASSQQPAGSAGGVTLTWKRAN